MHSSDRRRWQRQATVWLIATLYGTTMLRAVQLITSAHTRQDGLDSAHQLNVLEEIRDSLLAQIRADESNSRVEIGHMADVADSLGLQLIELSEGDPRQSFKGRLAVAGPWYQILAFAKRIDAGIPPGINVTIEADPRVGESDIHMSVRFDAGRGK